MLSLAKAVERLEDVSSDAQITLRYIIHETIYRKKSAACFVDHIKEINELEAAGLIVRVEDPVASMQFLGRNKLVKRLTAAGVNGFKKTLSIDALSTWCMESEDRRVLDAISDVVNTVPSPEIARFRIKLHTYLGRKFENDKFFDPDTNGFVDFPKDASFVCEIVMSADGTKRNGFWAFPDDEITDLLNKHGCNRCLIQKES